MEGFRVKRKLVWREVWKRKTVYWACTGFKAVTAREYWIYRSYIEPYCYKLNVSFCIPYLRLIGKICLLCLICIAIPTSIAIGACFMIMDNHSEIDKQNWQHSGGVILSFAFAGCCCAVPWMCWIKQMYSEQTISSFPSAIPPSYQHTPPLF